jgi:hypothetical protein
LGLVTNEQATERANYSPALLETVDAYTFCGEDVQPIDYLVKPIVTRGGTTVIYGQPKVGKTTFAYRLAAALLDPAIPFLEGVQPIGGQALLLDLEQPRRVTQRRLAEAGAGPTLLVYRGAPPALPRLLETVDQLVVRLLVVDSRWSSNRHRPKNGLESLLSAR